MMGNGTGADITRFNFAGPVVSAGKQDAEPTASQAY
jgi:hypothetical protein